MSTYRPPTTEPELPLGPLSAPPLPVHVLPATIHVRGGVAPAAISTYFVPTTSLDGA